MICRAANLHIVCLVVLFAAAVAGCEEDLHRPDYSDVPFSMYGVLSPDLDTQSVRVYPLEEVPTLNAAVDAEVRSIDLQTGALRIWRDSVVTDSTGRRGHVFWAPFRAEFDRSYRIEAVRRTDGATSFAEVRIPPPATVRIDEERAPLVDVIAEGESIRMTKPEAVYVVGDSLFPNRYNIRYFGTEQETDAGWRVRFNMIVDYEFIRFHMACGKPYCICRPQLWAFKLRALIGDAAWSTPGGLFDPNVLSVGRAMSNVENGFGFVGGGYELDAPLHLSPEAVDKACFTDKLDRDGGL